MSVSRASSSGDDSLCGCLLCGSGLLLLGRRREYRYSACSRCRAVQISPRISSDTLLELYRREYSSAGHYPSDAALQAEQRNVVIEDVTGLVLSLLPSREDPVLEVGCGWGGLVETLIAAGINASGLEPSEEMSAFCVSRSLPVRNGTLQDLCSEGCSYSMIVSMAVFEHLASPREELALYGRMLGPGGRAIIQCPTAGYARIAGRLLGLLRDPRHVELPSVFGLMEPPWHVCLPTPMGVEIAARESGLVLERALPSRSGREPSIRGLLQRTNEIVARSGTRIFGTGWPLVMGHVFVLAKPGS